MTLDELAGIWARPVCAGLIDQERYIGNDPVGHACWREPNKSFWLVGICWDVCEECWQNLQADNGRVTLPWWKARIGKG